MKPPHVIEVQAISMIEAVREGKTTYPDPAVSYVTGRWPADARKAARLLAAQANASRGRDLFWLIGVDPARSGNVALRGADPAITERWIATVSDFFDGIAPRVQAFPVPTGRDRLKPAIALQIETGRAPFVVRGALDRLETPWLDGGQVRAAGRMELVQLLSPLQALPGMEILEADLSFYRNPHVSAAARATFRWTLDAAVYVMPQAESRLVIPLHRCRGSVRIAGSSFRSEATDVSLTADKNSPAIRLTESAALIEGLGRFFIYCCGSTREPDLLWQNGVELLFDCTPVGAGRAATAIAALRPEPVLEQNQAGHWKL